MADHVPAAEGIAVAAAVVVVEDSVKEGELGEALGDRVADLQVAVTRSR